MVYRIQLTRTILCLLMLFTLLILFSKYCTFNSNPYPQMYFGKEEEDASTQNQRLVSESIPRPLVVMGILSNDEFRERRNTLRKTWIKTIQQMEKKLPFKIVYNFFLDKNTTESDEENKLHNDIVYLNVPEHGYANKYGRKVYVILQYIYRTYSEVELGIRIDDDVFLCVPQVFERLKEVMSANLYYGWQWDKTGPIDEMFVVLGKNVIKWIAHQTYCDTSSCDDESLQDTNYGSTSLQNWLKRYKNIDFKKDNERIDHIKTFADSKDWMKYVVPDYCKNHIVFHRVKITSFMNIMHRNNEMLKAKRFKDVSVSGHVFSGEKERVTPINRKIDDLAIARSLGKTYKCLFWAVVTTIFNPSKAINHIAGLDEWCLVIVADVKTPSKKQFMSMFEQKKKHNTVYLSVAEQLYLYPMLAESIPFSSFARKNIGYMFAIHNKAELIWDFDDDNIGIISKEGYRNTNNYLSVCEQKSTNVLINTYPYFRETKSRVWPRGFPLDLLKSNNILPKTCVMTTLTNLAVIQSLANGEADVDAIFRLTYNQFNFTAVPGVDKLFVLPHYTYTPFNAQATMWFPKAFQYMALPISVTGRVTDIWRSYIAEYFFNKIGLEVAFSPPYVFHNRTVHNIMGDFHAETPLYEQSGKLVELLSSNKYKDLVSLYEDLYERLYIEEEDLQFIRIWVKTYQFVTE